MWGFPEDVSVLWRCGGFLTGWGLTLWGPLTMWGFPEDVRVL